jgi:hypothetical protein
MMQSLAAEVGGEVEARATAVEAKAASLTSATTDALAGVQLPGSSSATTSSSVGDKADALMQEVDAMLLGNKNKATASANVRIILLLL